jgi:hypothetical protein
MSWSAYRAWNRACLLYAWRATRGHFGGGWRSVAEVLGAGFAATLVLYIWGGAAGSDRDDVVTLTAGAVASVLWIVIVFCWHVGLAPYGLWRAAQSRISQLTVGRRTERETIAQELELCIKEGQALMHSSTPSKRQLSKWYERALRVVSRAGDDDRIMLQSSGPAPGTRGGALELLILSNRINKLRQILSRQYPRRERESIRPFSSTGALRRG